MDSTEYSADPYEDGTVPSDADLAAPSTDATAVESSGADDDPASDVADDPATGADGQRNPDALVDGNRVATAEDME